MDPFVTIAGSLIGSQFTVLMTTESYNDSNITVAPNKTAFVIQSPYALWASIPIGIIFSIIIIGTFLGNTLVCTAVSIVKKLRSPSNLLIVSLAVADLLVSLLVMPFAALLEIRGGWELGQTFCNTWTSMDVMLCTASILNLCMISVDRYFVITRPFQYAMKRTPKRMALMIAGVWVTSALISIPPLFGWKSQGKEGLCIVSQAIGYQFYATIGSFYLPLGVMIFIYYRIYLVSSRIAKKEAKSMPSIAMNQEATALNNKSHNGNTADHNGANGATNNHSSRRKSLLKLNIFRKNGEKKSSSKDSKATKTLGVIMGAFTACWLPFFILALIRPFAGDHIPHWLNSLFLWLGYCNSFLNPIIYARFNRDFRTPFKEIILCRCRGINQTLRTMET